MPLIQLKSDLTDSQNFHQEVNKTFHNMEATFYDDIHEEMWENLPMQLNLLINDLEINNIVLPNQLSLLDVGCGTGLATHLLLQTAVTKKIDHVTLLDTSSVMLSYALKRSAGWGKPTNIYEGEVENITGKFDVIIISSVLHHIPDLGSFLHSVSNLLNEGGILITLHDPLQEALINNTYKKRCQEYREATSQDKISILSHIYEAVKRRVLPATEPNYIEQTNSVLLANNIIHTPLTEVEIWSVTDIHVEGLPYAAQAGISIKWLQDQLHRLNLISYRTYSFFGLMQHQLNKTYKLKEDHLIHSADKLGRNFGSLWIKNKEIP